MALKASSNAIVSSSLCLESFGGEQTRLSVWRAISSANFSSLLSFKCTLNSPPLRADSMHEQGNGVWCAGLKLGMWSMHCTDLFHNASGISCTMQVTPSIVWLVHPPSDQNVHVHTVCLNFFCRSKSLCHNYFLSHHLRNAATRRSLFCLESQREHDWKRIDFLPTCLAARHDLVIQVDNIHTCRRH